MYQDFAARREDTAKGLVKYTEDMEAYKVDPTARPEPRGAYYGLDENALVLWHGSTPVMGPRPTYEEFLRGIMRLDNSTVTRILATYGEDAEVPEYMPQLLLPPPDHMEGVEATQEQE